MVFFNSRNTDIHNKLLNLKEKVKNPYTDFFDWVNDEEIEIEALIEAIKSLLDIVEKKRKLFEYRESVEKDMAKLQEGKSTLGSMFSFKSKKEDLIQKENEKSKVINYYIQF